jgi:hypothetical protein
MEIELIKYPHDLYEVLKWAVNQDHKTIPPEFDEWFKDQLPPQCRDNTGHHTNVHTPDTPTVDGWVLGFPHSHTWSVDWPPDTFTCVTFLVMCEEGGEFGLGGLSPEDPYEFFTPEAGDSISFDALRWHGIRPVKKGVRISLLSTGMRPADQITIGEGRGREINFKAQ